MQAHNRIPLAASRDILHFRVKAMGAAVLLVAAVLSNAPAHATLCGAQGDMLTRSDPLMASVSPADCATVLQSAPAFTWPVQHGAERYTVALTFPDGHVESRVTPTNWLAWDRPVPAGTYSWSVRATGVAQAASQPRQFTVDAAAVSPTNPVVAAGRRAPPSAG